MLYAPGTQIAFDPALITRLKGEHQKLVNLFLAITAQVQSQQYLKVKNTMQEFLHEFNAHVLLEYTKLYVFLDYSFKNDSTTHDLIIEFRKEMNLIGKVVRSFYNNWKNVDLQSDNVGRFMAEFQQIGEVLVKRIKTEEENLYEIYQTSPALLMLDRQAQDELEIPWHDWSAPAKPAPFTAKVRRLVTGG